MQTDFGSVRIVEGAGDGPGATAEEAGFGGMWAALPVFARRMGVGPWAHPHHRPEASEAKPSSGAPSKVSEEELHRVLTLVQEGKLTPEEAQKLLRAMGQV
ncbi:MAG TPA: hypothetical protein VH208_09520 [Myxococcaceae bacterium]|nr:hypothetical protein [Myxococcaceae bacterium]